MNRDEELIKITKVERDNTKFKVYVNNSPDYVIFSENQLVKYRIIKGNCFYDLEWVEILESLQIGKVIEKAVKYINYTLRTEKEVRTYLKEKGYTIDVIDEVIVELKKNKIIDDDNYTKLYIENSVSHLMGPKVIEYCLLDKGINKDTIYKYLETYDDKLFLDNAFKVAIKTLKTIGGIPLKKQKETVFTKLSRMGYDSIVVSDVMNSITYNEVDLNILTTEYNKLKLRGDDFPKIVTKLLAKGYEETDIRKVITELEF